MNMNTRKIIMKYSRINIFENSQFQINIFYINEYFFNMKI